MILFFLLFSSFECPRTNVSQAEMAHAIFYIHQTGGACAGMCTCNNTHHIERTENPHLMCRAAKTNHYLLNHLQTLYTH